MSIAPIKKTPAYDSLLKAGYNLLLKHDGDMSKIKMQEVVAQAGVTSGAFYNVWPGGLQTFQQSLLEFALAAEHVSYLSQILADLQSADPAVTPLTEVARLYGGADAEHLKRDPGFRVQVALWARHGSDPGVAEALRTSYHVLSATYEQVYDSVLETYGRTWREPFDGSSFATLLTALAEGLAMRNAVDPENSPTDLTPGGSDARSWELFGLATAVLLNAVTTTAAADESESVWTTLAQLDAQPASGA